MGQPNWTCGRSSWTKNQQNGEDIFVNMWRNLDRNRRGVSGPDAPGAGTSKTGLDPLQAISFAHSRVRNGFTLPELDRNLERNRRGVSPPTSLKGISNEHLIHILEAGRIRKKPKNKSLAVLKSKLQRTRPKADVASDSVKVTVSAANPRSAFRPNGQLSAKTRIVGGGRVESQQQWPWVVMIKQNWKCICAGVLIAPQWVLTAAHCGFEKNIKNNTAPGPSWRVVAGESSQYELNQGIGISLAVMHDYTHYEDDIPRNDIMMLKLERLLEPT